MWKIIATIIILIIIIDDLTDSTWNLMCEHKMPNMSDTEVA